MANSYHLNAKRPVHTWSNDDRAFLAVLERFYNISRSEQQRIFNDIYQNKLFSEGYRAGAYSGLAAQISEMKKGEVGSENWQRVMQMPLDLAINAFEPQRRVIERAAKRLGILLLDTKSPNDSSCLSPAKRTREEQEIDVDNKLKKSALCTTAMSATSTSSTQALHPPSAAVELPFSPKSEAEYRTAQISTSKVSQHQDGIEDILRNVRLSPKLKVDCDFEGVQGKKRPRLLFRAFDPVHGFRARRFLNRSEVIRAPPGFTTPKFREEVEDHLRVNKTYKSPVLSFTESARRALKIVDTVEPTRSLAIFDIYDLEQDSTDRFGQRCRPYLVSGLCKQHQLYDLQGGYTGRREWLVWGSTECEPVAIFDKSKALELRETLQNMVGLDEKTGEALGKLLKDVDDERKEIVARSLVKAFKVPGCDADYNRAAWLDFADAVYRVNQGNRSKSVVSSLRGNSLEEEVAAGRDIDGWSELSGSVTEMSEEDMVETLEELKTHGLQILKQAQEADVESDIDEMQALIDAQLAAELRAYGLTSHDRSRASSIGTVPQPGTALEGLIDWVDVATHPHSSPVSSNSSSNSPGATPPSSASSSQTIIIDLTTDHRTDTDSDIDAELEILHIQEALGTPIEEETDADFVILGSGCRGRRTLPIRSKSRSVKFLRSRKIEKKKQERRT